MRYLHPVSHQEKFIASGTYVTTVAGEDASPASTEEWSIHRQPGDSRFIRIDRAATSEDEHLLAEILESPEGVIERLDLVRFRQVVTRRVSLTVFDTYIQIGYRIEPNEREYIEFDIPAGTPLLPPFLLFTMGAVSVNTVETVVNREWLVVDLATSVVPPLLRLESITWAADTLQALTIGRKQLDTQVYNGQSGELALKVWQDQRLRIPVRIEEYLAGTLYRVGELRSIAF